MNTGIGDAIDLAWKLAGTLQGWGGPGLLQSYEAERREIGLRNVNGSGFAAKGRGAWRKMWCEELWDDTPAGEEARQRMKEVANVQQRKTNEQKGTELGYRYSASPVICYEAGSPPRDDVFVYTPTTWPGARIPHVWLDDGRALQDCLGAGYTLLRAGGTREDAGALVQAMRALGAPVEVVEIPDAGVRAVVERDLVLLRPDLHVAWRGNQPPADPAKVAAMVTGRFA